MKNQYGFVPPKQPKYVQPKYGNNMNQITPNPTYNPSNNFSIGTNMPKYQESNIGLGNINKIVKAKETTANPEVSTNEMPGNMTRDEYIAKLWYEESKNDPNAVNKITGAKGFNQILPKYEQYYADQAGISLEESRTPAGQKKLADSIYDRTTKYLKRHKLPDTQLNRYGYHQQGPTGFLKMRKGNFDSQALRQNIPQNVLDSAPKNEPLDVTWNKYWSTKFSG